jgi:phenylpropionate dioxygenase-like ring-hydroxylating dioxygenase large terminal subunit
MGVPWVLWRGSDGEIYGAHDVCPHRRAPLSLGRVDEGLLACSYHGWRFDGTGACQEIPALGPDATIPSKACLVTPAGLTESHHVVFLAPEDPLTPVPEIPEASDPSFQIGDLPVIDTRGNVALLADNFLDMAHFPFVHAGTFGAEEAQFVEPYEVRRNGFQHIVEITHAFANREDPGVEAGIRPLIQQRRLTYTYTAPFHLSLRIEFLDAGGVNTIGFFLSPRDAEHVRIFSTLYRNDLDGDEARMKEAIEFEMAVVEEDLHLQSRFDILSVPLDITREVHTRVDKTTIEMRRILMDLVEATS